MAQLCYSNELFFLRAVDIFLIDLKNNMNKNQA